MEIGHLRQGYSNFGETRIYLEGLFKRERINMQGKMNY